MKASVEVLGVLERKLIIETSADQVEQEIDKRLKQMAAQYRIPGFRPGKAPMHLLRERYGEAVRNEVVGQVVDTTYNQAITQEKLLPAGMPKIQFLKNKAGEPLEYEAILEIYPHIELKGLEGIELENIKVDITQKDVDEMIQRLRHQAAKWNEVTHPAQKGDRVVVSYEGRQNGELFEGGSGKNVPVELGTGMAIPGFEEGFLQHSAGDSIEMNLTFPTDYHVAVLAGKPVEFKGTIHKVLAPELPPIDEEFAKQFGIKDGGIEELRKAVLEHMQTDVDQKVRGHLKGQLLEKLLALHTVEVPKVLIVQEATKLQQQEQQYYGKEKDKKPLEEPRPELIQLAKQRINLGLIFGEIIRTRKMHADPERVTTLLEKIAASYHQPQAIIDAYRSDKQLLRQLEETVIEDQVVDDLIAQAKLMDKLMPYRDFKGFKPAQDLANV